MWSMWPEGRPLSTGSVPSLNAGQKHLNKCFKHMKGQLPERLDFLILGGDMTEGANPAEGGMWIMESHRSFQIEAAAELLRPLVDIADEVYMIAGSRYHTGPGFQDEEALGEILDTIKNPLGGRAWPWLNLDADGVFLDIAHRQSVMLRYKSTPLERELQFSNNITPDLKEDCDAIYRAHSHMYVEVNVDGQLSIALPPWKLPDYYCQLSISPNRKISRMFGSLLVTIDPEVKASGQPNAGMYITNKFLGYKNPGVIVQVLGGANAKSARTRLRARRPS